MPTLKQGGCWFDTCKSCGKESPSMKVFSFLCPNCLAKSRRESTQIYSRNYTGGAKETFEAAVKRLQDLNLWIEK
jgi:predicted RNA-binding Zn-ribbon protein involved in translation (DUF1610 family)